jgi:hypothetical protein
MKVSCMHDYREPLDRRAGTLPMLSFDRLFAFAAARAESKQWGRDAGKQDDSEAY